MKNIKLNVGGDGLGSLWKEYQLASIKEIIAHGERTSAEVWNGVKDLGIQISRASVIFFLNGLVENDLAQYREKTGKGGFHRIYSVREKSLAEFNNTILDKILYKLWEIFPENERIKAVLAV